MTLPTSAHGEFMTVTTETGDQARIRRIAVCVYGSDINGVFIKVAGANQSVRLTTPLDELVYMLEGAPLPASMKTAEPAT